MKKIITKEQAAGLIEDGSSVMINGFMGVKSPDRIIEAIVQSTPRDLTIIANDSGLPNHSIGRLVAEKRIKKIIASHIGLNPDTGKAMHDGEIEVELVPQGTLAERIRCGGAGIGGFLTPTGLGTEVETGKQKLTVNGQEYLLELPLKADFALIKGSIVDKAGNIFYKGTTKNFSLVMAMAAKTVIVEAEQLVEVGEIDPNHIMTPGIFVDYIVAP